MSKVLALLLCAALPAAALAAPKLAAPNTEPLKLNADNKLYCNAQTDWCVGIKTDGAFGENGPFAPRDGKVGFMEERRHPQAGGPAPVQFPAGEAVQFRVQRAEQRIRDNAFIADRAREFGRDVHFSLSLVEAWRVHQRPVDLPFSDNRNRQVKPDTAASVRTKSEKMGPRNDRGV